jgi:hypothetical protein
MPRSQARTVRPHSTTLAKVPNDRLFVRRRPSPPVCVPPLPAPGPNLLRILDGAVVDFPAPVLRPDVHRWAATCWVDPTEPGGWGRAVWWPSPYGRGYVPVALDYADVVEFGADIPIRQGRATAWLPVRWYGIIVERAERWLIVHGPHLGPGSAKAVADDLRATVAYYHCL